MNALLESFKTCIHFHFISWYTIPGPVKKARPVKVGSHYLHYHYIKVFYQDDPLAMSMYALAVVPLIRRLRSSVPDASQVWFADDATAVGTASALLEWWHHLFLPALHAFGYFRILQRPSLLNLSTCHKLSHFLLILISLLQCRASDIWVQLLVYGLLPRSVIQKK